MLAHVSFLSNNQGKPLGLGQISQEIWKKNLSTVYLFFQLKEESEEEEDQTGLITPADT